MKQVFSLALLMALSTTFAAAQSKRDLCQEHFKVKLQIGKIYDGNNRKSNAAKVKYHFRDGLSIKAKRNITQEGRDKVWLRIPFNDKYDGKVKGIKITYSLVEANTKLHKVKKLLKRSHIKGSRVLAVASRNTPVLIEGRRFLYKGKRVTKTLLSNRQVRDTRKKQLAFSFVLNKGDVLTFHKAEVLFTCE